MAKPNYAFAKRQRDLAKKAKKEEKRLRKAGTDGDPVDGDSVDGDPTDATVDEGAESEDVVTDPAEQAAAAPSVPGDDK